MILVLLIGLAFVGVAFGLFARALLASRLEMAETINQIGAYGFEVDRKESGREAHRPRFARWDPHAAFNRASSSIGGALVGRGRSLSEEGLRRLLLQAGFYTLPPQRFVGYQALGTLLLGGLWIWLAVVSGFSALLAIAGTILALLSGWTTPTLYLRRRAQSRTQRIDYDMPELIDMLVATIEAGIAFSASLQIAARRFHGPLGDELRLTLQEQTMGLGLNEALANMQYRCDTPSVRSFVRSLAQGEQLGVSVGQTLRNLAHEMRSRRRQMAQERAHRAPVKLVFPLVLFIFPVLLIVILGPAVLRFKEIFG